MLMMVGAVAFQLLMVSVASAVTSANGDVSKLVTSANEAPRGAADSTRPTPTLVFGTTIRIAEAYAGSPGATAGDGCLAAEQQLLEGNFVVSKVVFDGKQGRLRQSNTRLERIPTQNVTSIGRWDLPVPQEWDLATVAGDVSCTTEALPLVMCKNGSLPPSCPPTFGSWGALNPFSSILGMWYPNTTKLPEFSTADYDTYQFEDVKLTLVPNNACGTADCTMAHCSTCNKNEGRACTECPCKHCTMELNVTRNYTYTVAKKPQADGTHPLIRYQWTQGIPLTKGGATPGVGRDCFIFDWSKDWTADVHDSDFAPPPGMKCAGTARPVEETSHAAADWAAKPRD